MNRLLPFSALMLAVCLHTSASVSQGQSPSKEIHQYLIENAESLGLTASDLKDIIVTDQYSSKHNGVTHLYLQQRHESIPVFGAQINLTVGPDGDVLHVANRFVPDLQRKIGDPDRSVPPEDAVHRAARSLGLELSEPLTPLPRASKGPTIETRTPDDVLFSAGGISLEPIPVNLMYVPLQDGRVRLAWTVEVYSEDAQSYWLSFVDTETGEVLQQIDLVVKDHADFFATGEDGLPVLAWEETSLLPYARLAPLPETSASSSGSYRVYPGPVESPSHAGNPTVDLRVLVSNPDDPTASPLGWHDDGTTAYTVTRGNNVHAYTDVDADNVPDPGSDPDGGVGLDFDFPLDLTMQPDTYRDAAVTNLFYWNNLVHDIAYQYGFDEPAGNFQVDNFGNGGLGGDDVRAEAQDGSGFNNANFFTPVDGNRPRMQMFQWLTGFPNELVVDAPVSDTYDMSAAAFGPFFDATGIGGTLVLADDGGGTGTATDGCEPLINGAAVSGNIALIDRGVCSFVTKARNAQNVGATAVVIINNVAGNPITLGNDGTGGDIVIPSGMISLADGNTIKAALPGVTGTARANTSGPPRRDSDLDNGVIVHEYAHGISTRLTGGPSENICLANFLVNGQVDGEQMGEGWSDYYAMMLTDTDTDDRGIATYLVFEPPTGQGIRPFKYSPNFGINPATYLTINNPNISVPHGVGTVWATMIWDMTRALADRHGFDPDVYSGSGGNNISLQLVTDGLKLQPCFPGFVDGRDAILAADAAMGGRNECLIWDAFAPRGLGASADQGFFFTRFDGVEAFDLPNSCCTFAILTQKVNDLHDAGVLNDGQASSLLAKLANAEGKIAEGNLNPAYGSLQAFVNQVNDLTAAGVLTEEEGADLASCGLGLINRTEQENPETSGKASAELAEVEDAASAREIPDSYALDQNYPNPFNPTTRIRFAVPQEEHVVLTIYDVMGRDVKRLVDGRLSAGFYEVLFEASELSSGTYLYRLQAGEYVDVKRMALLQ